MANKQDLQVLWLQGRDAKGVSSSQHTMHFSSEA